MDSTTIYYFSGTGNSLFVAQEVQKQLKGAELIPIVSALKKGTVISDADNAGFIFPIYMMGMSLPVYNFIKKLDLSNTKYIFALATRMGTTHSAFNTISKLLKKKKKKIDAHFNLTMCDNSAKFNYKCPTDDEIMHIEKNVIENISTIVKKIENRQISKEKDTTANQKINKVIMNILANLANSFDTKHHADDNCISCGTCEKVCLSGKVKMIDEKPDWDKKVMCYKCNACVSFCQKQAAQITKYSEGNDRYSHPYATAEDIAMQKQAGI